MAREALLQQFAAYPLMQPQDAVKLLFQRRFGAGHAVAGGDCLLRLREEYAGVPQSPGPLWEEIGGGICRVRLCALEAHAVLPDTLNMLFVEGAAQLAPPPQGAFLRDLVVLGRLAKEGITPFSAESCGSYLAAYAAAGYPAVSHSAAYRAAYHPAYRVLPVSLARLLPLCSAIDRRIYARRSCVLLLDGRCGAGKTSLAKLLQKLYACAMIRMDDFYLPQELRTAERLHTPGGNIHFERFSREVSRPLAAGQRVRYRPYDCAAGEYGPMQSVLPAALTVIEGSYSQHPLCEAPSDIRVFLTVEKQVQLSRLRERESPDSYARFLSDWIPMEEAYFSAFGTAQNSQFVIDTSL